MFCIYDTALLVFVNSFLHGFSVMLCIIIESLFDRLIIVCYALTVLSQLHWNVGML